MARNLHGGPIDLLTRYGLRCSCMWGGISMRRKLILALVLLAGVVPSGAFAQAWRETVRIEVYLPEDARLLVEGRDTKSTGTKRLFTSPPLQPGKYVYTVQAIIPDPKGPRTITRRLDVRPGDFESIDLRPAGERR